jgi:hypothetical protein
MEALETVGFLEDGRSAIVKQFLEHREENRGSLTRTGTKDIRLINRCINASISTTVHLNAGSLDDWLSTERKNKSGTIFY